ncbi:DUF6249 domain-containing protein [Caulobacter segnis]|uniref:DUF6249 domain-containing protein n=1 Tax=Caulobacter segnis TaxID=88688 RepID=A0A2W5VC57_9CAUL|nr:DUF6249 domain-containing protein [Caulobacter segnis]PZR36187.1 MAG: hypothetical protein DI526_04320 [Caulobacter segnis]
MGPDIVVPVVGCMMIVAIVVLPFYFKSKERREMQATIRTAIEKGQPLPPEVIETLTKSVKLPPSRLRDIRTGVMWLAVGLGLAAFGVVIGREEGEALTPLLAVACMPAFIGVAYIILSFFNPNKEPRV